MSIELLIQIAKTKKDKYDYIDIKITNSECVGLCKDNINKLYETAYEIETSRMIKPHYEERLTESFTNIGQATKYLKGL